VYPKNRIAEIDRLLGEMAAKDQQYNTLIVEADAHFAGENYRDSKAKYQSALQVKPNESYPKQRIDEINAILKDLAAAREQDAQYQALIQQADAAFNREAWSEAKTFYAEALFIKSNEQYPKDQIAKIDAQLDKEKAYTDLINQADGLFKMDELTRARALYVQASEMKPSESYPKSQIAAIDARLDANRRNEMAYQQAIAGADEKFNAQAYSEAKTLYQKALELKSGEAYPKNQIQKIEDLLAQQRAEQEKLAQQRQQYEEAIATADRLFKLEEYDDAISFYQQASRILPGEQYPGNQIARIKDILAQQQAEAGQAYRDKISEADQRFNGEQYEAARRLYNEAIDMKPDELYPKNQLKRIEDILAQRAREEQQRQKMEEEYAGLIDRANGLYDNKDYVNARSVYEQALQIKPNEQFPKLRIEYIDELLDSFEAAKNKKTKQAQTTKKVDVNVNEGKLHDLKFNTSRERSAYLSRLAKAYPEGVTVENYRQNNQRIKRVIVNYDGVATEYREVKHSWGGVYYFRNDKSISKNVFMVETKER